MSSLEGVVVSLLQPFVGQDCAVTLSSLAVTSPLSVPQSPCFSLLVSKVLSVGIVVGGSIVKVPQILKIVSAGSAKGISLAAYLLESFAFTVSVAYNLRRGNPFSTFGENVFLTIQNYVILALMFYYARNAVGFALSAAFFAAFLYAALDASLVPESALVTLVWSAIAVGSASKFPQIYANFAAGSTGMLSPVTLGLQLAGSVARVYTTLREVDDLSILVSFLAGTVLNAILFAQLVVYWKRPGKEAAKGTASKGPRADEGKRQASPAKKKKAAKKE
ncbi:hypothetical protein HK405_003485 [Cladochytrium tenue]|nr:hypothetical protein HK405_003485 [Cladochytrium tenue]